MESVNRKRSRSSSSSSSSSGRPRGRQRTTNELLDDVAATEAAARAQLEQVAAAEARRWRGRDIASAAERGAAYAHRPEGEGVAELWGDDPEMAEAVLRLRRAGEQERSLRSQIGAVDSAEVMVGAHEPDQMSAITAQAREQVIQLQRQREYERSMRGQFAAAARRQALRAGEALRSAGVAGAEAAYRAGVAGAEAAHRAGVGAWDAAVGQGTPTLIRRRISQLQDIRGVSAGEAGRNLREARRLEAILGAYLEEQRQGGGARRRNTRRSARRSTRRSARRSTRRSARRSVGRVARRSTKRSARRSRRRSRT